MTGTGTTFAHMLRKYQPIECGTNVRIPNLNLLRIENGNDLFHGLCLELALLNRVLLVHGSATIRGGSVKSAIEIVGAWCVARRWTWRTVRRKSPMPGGLVIGLDGRNRGILSRRERQLIDD